MNRVRELRKAKNMQQKELALAIGVSFPTVSEWERQKKDPSGERLQKLAEFFSVEPIEIITAPNTSLPYRMPTDEELKFALFNGADGITQEDFDDVKKYAEFVIARKKGMLK